MDEREAKLKELVGNEVFVEKISNVTSVDEAKNIFSEYGVEVSTEEIEAMRNAIKIRNCNEELSDKDLENVSGGGIMSWLFWWMDDMNCAVFGKPFWEGGTCD